MIGGQTGNQEVLKQQVRLQFRRNAGETDPTKVLSSRAPITENALDLFIPDGLTLAAG